jgi:adenylate kinase
MRLILEGPPAAGKGTLGELLSKKLNIPHISTGDMFRASIEANEPLGVMSKQYLEKGLLVPDDIVLKLVMDRLSKDDCKNGYILDGFPRDLVQAKKLAEELTTINSKIDYVINIKISDDVIIKRISGRRVCSSCHATYHVVNRPSKVDGICDVCGNTLIKRPDDNETTIVERLEVYHHETAPLIEYYTSRGKIIDVDGNVGVDITISEVLSKLEEAV